MQRRSQGNENLAEVQLDITAFERSNRRGTSRASTRNSEEPRMETGEGSGEVRGDARQPSNPARRNIPARNERDVEDGDDVRIGAYDEPGTRVVRTGIVVPETPNNFNMKQGLMNGVKDLKFRGRPSENPLDHLEAFDRLCNLYKTGNVSLDTIRMTMFPFSLADDAEDWVKEISSELVSTWEDVKREFLKAFFPKEKTTRIRSEIIAFKQRKNKTFTQAWDRMKRYLRSCPHHGFTRDSILGIFYKGCNASNRMHLNSASGGSFANRTVKDGENIVADLARGSSQPCDEEDDEHEDSYAKVEDKVLKEMHRKLDLVLKGQSSRKEVSFVKEADHTEGYYDPDYDEEMCYVENNQGYQNRNYSNQGYNNNGQQFRNNYGGQTGGQQPRFNNSYQGNQRTFPPNNNFNSNRQQPYNNSGGNFQRPPFQTNQPYGADNQQNRSFSYQDRMEKLEELITRAMEDSNKVAIEYGKRIDSLGETINRRMDGWDEKLDRMTERVSTLERNLADVAASMKPHGKNVLPGKPEPNPREYCQFGGEDRDAAWKQKPSGNSITFDIEEVYGTNPLDEYYETRTERQAVITPPSYYLPPPSFPNTTERARRQSRAYDDVLRALRLMEGTEELRGILAHDKEFGRNFQRIRQSRAWYENKSHPLPIKGAGHSRPTGDLAQVHYVMEKLGESERWDDFEKKNTEILERIDASNPEDPGCFAMPCFVNGTAFRKCVLDLGASKSIMPIEIAKAIGITNINGTSSSLVLADWSSRKTLGIATSIPISFEGYTIRTDFLIIDTKQAGPGKIILGRPFLEECNAKFDAREGLVNFKIGNNLCTIGRDPYVDGFGRKMNMSLMKFFQQLALETRKRSACLGGSTDMNRKHRIVELVEEYELFRFKEASQHDRNDEVQIRGKTVRGVMINKVGDTQGRLRTYLEECNRISKRGKASFKGFQGGSKDAITPPIAKIPSSRAELFEWRTKPKEATPTASTGKTSEGSDKDDQEGATPTKKDPQDLQGTLETLEEGEIEPGDKEVDTSGFPPLPN